MLKTFQSFIYSNFSFLENSKLLVAVSGGLDSMVLVYLCQKLDLNFSLAHCNYKLREIESNYDEDFIKSYAKTNSIELFTTSFDTNSYASLTKQSIQMAARKLRYEWFELLQEQHGFDFVLTAHHADDNLETFLINLSRGTGLEGLTGIPAINGSIIRPLLEFTRTEILDFATAKNLKWREDSSNKKVLYLRNNIRHSIIPLLKNINPSFMDSFNKSQKYLIESQSVLKDYILEIEDRVIASVAEDQISYDINKILTLNNPKAYMYLLLKPYGFTDWNEIISLLQAQTGKQIYSPSHRLIKNRNNLILCKINTQLEVNISIQNSDSLIKIPSYGINLHMDITNFLPVKSPESVILDVKTLNFPLTVRNWNEGDYFYPIGMKGKKKLSKFFKDNKLSIVDKENTLILCSNDQVVWVLGMRADNRFMSTEKTINFLNISIKNNASN
jgi:tRNA(Ile)-lysidine synthase